MQRNEICIEKYRKIGKMKQKKEKEWNKIK